MSDTITELFIKRGFDVRDANVKELVDDIYQQIREWDNYSEEEELCDVEGCDREPSSGGMCWRETGYWSVCSKHSQIHRDGEPQPRMKQDAIGREKTRDADGMLPSKAQ